MCSLMRTATPLSKAQCSAGRTAPFPHSEANFARRAALRRQRPKRCAMASNDDPPMSAGSAHPFKDRLRSIPAYQRLKARKQQPQETGAPKTSTPAEEIDGSNQESKIDGPEAFKRPEPGLGHRLKARPVGRQPVNQGPPTDPSRQTPSPAASEAQQSSRQQPPVQSQPSSIPSQTPTQQPRATLQPLSAMPNLSQAAAIAQVPVRHADFAGVQQQDQKSMASVQFCLTYHAEFGQRLRVVGSHKNLGLWVMVEGPELKWTEGDRWRASVDLPAGGIYEYKYVLLDSTGMNALTWQRGNNSVLAVKQDEGELEVFDNWEGQPGAAVRAGGKSSTRESKLLAWATDIEAQLGLQRQELRRSRVELASAQEDARRARQEARVVRMELAQSQTVRAQADKVIRELQSNNRLLKSELQATATTFKKALHVAQIMLDTAEEREESIPERVKQATELPADDPSPTPPTTAFPPDQPPSEEQSATSTASQVESASPQTTLDDSISPDFPEVQASSDLSLKQEEKEEANAVISTPDKEEEARDQGVRTGTEAMQGSVAAISTSEEEEEARDQGVKVGSGGMQGSVAESSASSNARKQSTSSEASSRPKPVSPGGSSVVPESQNTQAGRPPSSPRGFLDSPPTSASSSAAAEAQQGSPAQGGSGTSRPRTLEDMPKHSTSSDKEAAASPPKAPGGFPASAPAAQPSSPGAAGSGKQLETIRTAVPVEVEKSNAAAASPTAAATGMQKLAGKQLELSGSAVPPDVQDSNAAASQVSAEALGSGRQDQGSGMQLESGKNTVPLDVEGSNAAAQEAPTAGAQPDMGHANGDGRQVAAGEQLLQGAQAIPKPPSPANASAKSSRKDKKRKKKSLRRQAS